MKGEDTGVETLTDKQKEVLRLISRHMQAKEIARILNITERTVKAHTKAARDKLGVASSREAARVLAEYDRASSIVLEGQWPSSAISLQSAPEPFSDHGQDFSTGRPISDSELEGTGTGLADDGIARQVRPDRGRTSDSSSHSTGPRPGKSDLYDRGSDGVVDGRQAVSRRLEDLSTFSYLKLMIIKAMWMLLIGAGLVMGILGVLQAVHNVMRYAD